MPTANITEPVVNPVSTIPVVGPAPVPAASPATQPIGSLDRAPAGVNPAEDPEIPQPQPPQRVQARRPAAVETPYQETAPANPIPTEELPVDEPTVELDSVVPEVPQYVSVLSNGQVVVSSARVLDFLGNGVSVTAQGSTANITIAGTAADLGNWTFSGNTLYNFNGGAVNNSDSSHGATAGLSIPTNGSTSTAVLLNYYGSWALVAGTDPGNSRTWVFGSNGNITLPTNSAGINYANGQPYGGSNYGDSNVVSLLSSFGSNTISTTGNIAGTFVAPDGNTSVLINANGVIGAAPGFSFDSDAGMLFSPGVTAAGNAESGIDALYVGVGGYVVLGSTVIAQLTSNVNSYSQINQQNISTGNLASADYIITADNGTDSTYYLDVGLAGSNHADPDFFGDTASNNDAYIYVTATDQAGPSSPSGPGNLILGSTNGVIKLFVGNTAQANVIATVASDGMSVLGNIVGVTANNSGHIRWVGNSSGDGFGFTTMQLVPDDTRESADSYLIIDPTGPNHIHIRAGGTQDDSPAQLYLGGENSHFKVDNGLNPNVYVTANSYKWTFGSDGNFTLPGDNVATAFSRITSLANSSGDGAGYTTLGLIPDINLTGADQYLIIDPTAPGHIHIRAGGQQDNSSADLFLGGEYTHFKVTAGANNQARIMANSWPWTFGADGTFTLPANAELNGSQINSVANSSGDGAGYTTLQLVPDVTVGTGTDQYLIIDPTAPGHIHIRAGGQQDNSAADLFLGGENSYFRVAAGANAQTQITSNSNTWVFNTDGNLQVPGNINGDNNAPLVIDGASAGVGYISLPHSTFGGEQIAIVNKFGLGNGIRLETNGGNLFFDNNADLSVTGNITGNTAGFAIGYRDIPQVGFSANANAALTDAGKHFYSTTAGNLQLTLQDDSNIAFQTGATLTVVVNAAGNVLVNQAAGVSLYMAGSPTTGNRVVGAYGLATVMKVAANTWVINGTGVY